MFCSRLVEFHYAILYVSVILLHEFNVLAEMLFCDGRV